jgi:hypothetical protein
MKNKIVLMGLICFLVAILGGCSSENDWEIKPGDPVYFEFTRTDVPYSPMNISEMPSWLQDRISNPLFGVNRMIAYAGSLDAVVYYNVEPGCITDSYYNPVFRDKEGNIIDKDQETSPIYRITNWVCIYYEEL